MKSRWIASVGLAGLLAAPNGAVAQTVPRVAISVEAARSGNGARAGLEDMLRQAGMDDTDPFSGAGFFGTGIESQDHPYTTKDSAWGVDIRVRVRPRITVGYSQSVSNSGATRGYYAPDSDHFRSVSFFADYSVESRAALIHWHPMTRLRVGAGPAFHTLQFEPLGTAQGVEERKTGWVAEAGFAFLNRKYVLGEVTARYRGMPALSVPSMTLREDFPFSSEPYSVTLPATDVRLQHWTLGIGFGLKFGS